MAVSTRGPAGRAPDGRTLAIEEAGLDWFEGMGQENVDDFRLLTSDPQAARDKLKKSREETLAASAAEAPG